MFLSFDLNKLIFGEHVSGVASEILVLLCLSSEQKNMLKVMEIAA